MGPPLPPCQCGTEMASAKRSKIEIECYLDLICPFSCKMFTTLYQGVLPVMKDDKDVSFLIQQVVQPWHPQGTMVHEAALSVKAVCPEAYLQYVNAIYRAFEKGAFKDDVTWNKTRMEMYQDLLQLAEKETSVDVAAVKKLLMPTGSGGNEGNAMTQDIKWAVKYHRTRGVHVTPTVFVNGLEAAVVSSGWSTDDWIKFLNKRGDDNFRGT